MHLIARSLLSVLQLACQHETTYSSFEKDFIIQIIYYKFRDLFNVEIKFCKDVM